MQEILSNLTNSVQLLSFFMASRFNFFWKELISSSLTSSEWDAPFGKERYRSVILSDTHIDEIFNDNQRHPKQNRRIFKHTVDRFEDVAS